MKLSAPRFDSAQVLVIGDLMLDRYWYGNAARISPEAPVPVVEVTRESHRLGGGANVANNIRALGANPVLIGVVGEDTDANLLRECLVRADLGVDGLQVDPDRPTTVKTRIVAQSHHLVRYDRESRAELGPDRVASVLAACPSSSMRPSWVTPRLAPSPTTLARTASASTRSASLARSSASARLVCLRLH